jgi:hypothetical protein
MQVKSQKGGRDEKDTWYYRFLKSFVYRGVWIGL